MVRLNRLDTVILLSVAGDRVGIGIQGHRTRGWAVDLFGLDCVWATRGGNGKDRESNDDGLADGVGKGLGIVGAGYLLRILTGN
jgi:hypothetical protein